MKKLFLLFLSTSIIVIPLFAQGRPSLTILPFDSNSNSSEEAIMVLLARDRSIRDAFNLVASAGSFYDIISRISEKDGAVSIKDKFRADFAVLVKTERVGNGNLVFLSIVRTSNLQLLTGDYRKYIEIREVRAALPSITKKLVRGTQVKSDMPKLTFMPLYTGVNGLKAETMKQAISIELANREKYTILPWALITNGLNTELPNPYSGIIDLDEVKNIGTVTGIPYVVKGDVLSLGTVNLVLASVLKTENASFLTEGENEFRVITEDLAIVSNLAAALEKTPLISPVSSNPDDNLIRIDASSFLMGSPETEVSRDGDESQHYARVDIFSMGKYEVTQAEYEALMGSNPSRFKRADFPVEQVSWFDAIRYCNERSKIEGLTPVYAISDVDVVWNHDANGYRLPTEAEWEYACRAGTTTAFNTGDGIVTGQSNFDGRYPYNSAAQSVFRAKTMPVGSFAPNTWGLYDMHGNVYEWCWDQYKSYTLDTMDGSLAAHGVIRGGSWDSEARFLRSANRAHAPHDSKRSHIGFRVVRTVK
jgi:formylglycine-generating enzyme required for sulfatase activity